MLESAVRQSEVDNLLRLVDKAFESLGVGASSARLPNKESFSYGVAMVPVGVEVNFFSNVREGGAKTQRRADNAQILFLVDNGSTQVSIQIRGKKVEPPKFRTLRT